MKQTLESYIDPRDFPKRYGGQLDWDFGMLPHMDDDSMHAVEKDGRSGWVEGPCLWLNHERFAVGTVDGKLRRPDSEIAALKPVVYAADKTDEPVHPDQALVEMNMNTAAHQEKSESRQKEEVAASESERLSPTPLHPVTSSTIASINPSHPTVSYQNQNPNEMPTQAAHAEPGTTAAPAEPETAAIPAEPIPEPSGTAPPSESVPAPPSESVPAVPAAAAVVTQPEAGKTEDSVNSKKKHHFRDIFHHKSKNSEDITHEDKPAESNHTAVLKENTTVIKQPGGEPDKVTPGRTTGTINQVNMHESLVHDMTTKKMEGESVSVILSAANGNMNDQKELVVASDPTKGLALETDKLNINGQAKPPMERFVTAVEDLTTVNGRA